MCVFESERDGSTGKTRLTLLCVCVDCIASPWTCTGPASCWPSWCSLTNPWWYCGWSGRSSPPVSSAFEYQMAKAGPGKKKSKLPRDLTGAPANTTWNVFLVLPAPSPPPPALSCVLSQVSFFHPLVWHKRQSYFLPILTHWFKATPICSLCLCVCVFGTIKGPGCSPNHVAIHVPCATGVMLQLTCCLFLYVGDPITHWLFSHTHSLSMGHLQQ